MGTGSKEVRWQQQQEDVINVDWHGHTSPIVETSPVSITSLVDET